METIEKMDNATVLLELNSHLMEILYQEYETDEDMEIEVDMITYIFEEMYPEF